MKEIALTRGMVAIVDDEDFEVVSKHRWHVQPGTNTTYAARCVRADGKILKFFMHWAILPREGNSRTDHINGNGLDNRRANLRRATNAQNVANSRQYKGIWRARAKWAAAIMVNGKRHFLGVFDTEDAAISARRDGEKRFLGEFAPSEVSANSCVNR